MNRSNLSGKSVRFVILIAVAVSAVFFISITCMSVLASEKTSHSAEEVNATNVHESVNAHESEAEKKLASEAHEVTHETVEKHQSGEKAAEEAVSEKKVSEEHQSVKKEEASKSHEGTKEKEAAKEAEKPEEPQVTGARFAEASVEVLKKELNSFWGWRPNDYITFFTDNTKNFQLGVLEVARRAAVVLSERISRTGSTASLNKNLEEARNLLMVKADAYMFPSAGFSYENAVEDIEKYREQLIQGHAAFFNRTDNLIPLLQRFEDLLGSCDENLVKQTEEDGTTVSTFAADDYFYYAQGVASAMVPILEAISEDFHETISSRLSMPTLHHITHSCEEAADLHPWMVFNGDLDGIIANHRANMATFISHARFYVGVLIKTLST